LYIEKEKSLSILTSGDRCTWTTKRIRQHVKQIMKTDDNGVSIISKRCLFVISRNGYQSILEAVKTWRLTIIINKVAARLRCQDVVEDGTDAERSVLRCLRNPSANWWRSCVTRIRRSCAVSSPTNRRSLVHTTVV